MFAAVENLLKGSQVDPIVPACADPFLAASVVRGERLQVTGEYQTDEYDLFGLRRAGDLAPLERERTAIILGELP